MADTVTVAIMTGMAMIGAAIIGKGFDLLMARLNAKNAQPTQNAVVNEADARADEIRASHNLRTIKQLDEDNLRLQAKQTENDKRIYNLEANQRSMQVTIDAQASTIRRQDGYIRLLSTQVVALGGTPIDIPGLKV